jgi:hypothetical protein
MANENWVAAEQTATGPGGQKMALIGGQWQQASQSATGPKGEKMVVLSGGVAGGQQPTAGAGAGGTVHKTLSQHAQDIAGAGAFGVVAGAAAPYLFQVGGMAASVASAAGAAGAAGSLGVIAAPALATVGMVLGGTAAVMKTMRLGEVAAGAISGIAGESATKIAERFDSQHPGLWGLGASMLTPGAGTLIKFVAGPLKPLWTAVQKFAGNADAGIPAAVKVAEKSLRELSETGHPQNAMHEALAHGVEADRKAAADAGHAHIVEETKRAATIAETDAPASRRVITEAHARVDEWTAAAAKRARVLNEATKGKLATASRVSAMADKELKGTVGLPQHESDIGNALRKKVTAGQKSEIEAKNAQYAATVAQRDAVVAAKEQAGIHVDAMPEMKALKDEISRKLLLTKKGQEAAQGKAEVTEQGVMSAYQKVYEAVGNRRVQTGVNEAGNPTYQMFKTTFEALDHVRRKLGDAAFGKEAEGYGALGQGIAKSLYSRISKIQEEFAGPAQKELQSGYHEALGGLQKYSTAAGKKLTAVDRLDPQAFAKDAKTIPGAFFHSQQGVRDLVELTGGDKAFVAKHAQDYAAKQLEGQSAKQVAKWAKDNADWVREIPGLQQKVAAYGKKLAQIERLGGKGEQPGKLALRAAATAKEAKDVVTKASTLAEKHLLAAREEAGKIAAGSADAKASVLEAAKTRGAEITKEQFAPSAKLGAILTGKEAPGAIRNLLLHGAPEQTRLAARHLAGTPDGQEMLNGSVRQVLAGMREKELTTTWHEQVRPMLKEGQMLPPKVFAKLEADVQGVLRAYKGKDRVPMVAKLVRSALAGGAGVGAVAATGGFGG